MALAKKWGATRWGQVLSLHFWSVVEGYGLLRWVRVGLPPNICNQMCCGIRPG